MMKKKKVDYLRKGHPVYPGGAVLVEDYENLDLEGNPTVTEHTLEEWAELQQSAQ